MEEDTQVTNGKVFIISSNNNNKWETDDEDVSMEENDHECPIILSKDALEDLIELKIKFQTQQFLEKELPGMLLEYFDNKYKKTPIKRTQKAGAIEIVAPRNSPNSE